MRGLSANEFREDRGAIAARETVLRTEAAVSVREEALDRTAPVVDVQLLGLREWLRRECDAAWAACGMFERVAFTYLGVSMACIALFADNVTHPLRLIETQGFVAILILLLCRLEARVVDSEKFNPRAGNEKTGYPLPTFAERFWHFWRPISFSYLGT